MELSLLNCLIDAQGLTLPVDEAGLDDYAQQIANWQLAVEASVAQLPRPLSQAHEQAIHQLLIQGDTMIENLSLLRQSLYKEHQQLLKGSAAAHAYFSSGT